MRTGSIPFIHTHGVASEHRRVGTQNLAFWTQINVVMVSLSHLMVSLSLLVVYRSHFKFISFCCASAVKPQYCARNKKKTRPVRQAALIPAFDGGVLDGKRHHHHVDLRPKCEILSSGTPMFGRNAVDVDERDGSNRMSDVEGSRRRECRRGRLVGQSGDSRGQGEWRRSRWRRVG